MSELSINAILNPTGFSRLSLPWFAPDDVIDFILDAITFVAEEGWKFMVHYDINTLTGEWKHISKMKNKGSFGLQKISYNKGFFEYRPQQVSILPFYIFL